MQTMCIFSHNINCRINSKETNRADNTKDIILNENQFLLEKLNSWLPPVVLKVRYKRYMCTQQEYTMTTGLSELITVDFLLQDLKLKMECNMDSGQHYSI